MSFLFFCKIEGAWSHLIDNLFSLEQKSRFSISPYGEIAFCPGDVEEYEWIYMANQNEVKHLIETAYDRDHVFAVTIVDKACDGGLVCSITTKEINITIPASAMPQEEFETAVIDLMSQLDVKVRHIEFSSDMRE